MAERRSDWVEIVEPRSRERMYVNLLTGECGWEPPLGVPVRQADGNQWWELFDSNNNRFYYYNSTSQQTVWHRPQDCDIVPLAQLQAIKKSSEAELKGHGRPVRPGAGAGLGEGRNTPLPKMVSPVLATSQDLEIGREVPSAKGREDSLEKMSQGSREPAQRWQPAPGSKAALLVKVNNTGRNQSATPASTNHLVHLGPSSSSSTYTPSHPSRPGHFGNMAVPGDPKQAFHLKKADNGSFCLVVPNSGSASCPTPQHPISAAQRPSSPPYGATPTAPAPPIYDEPPAMDPPIYDEPPVEMEVEGVQPLTRSHYTSTPAHSLPRAVQPPKLLQFPHGKHRRNPSAGDYSPAGRECIKHMVNVDPSASRLIQPQHPLASNAGLIQSQPPLSSNPSLIQSQPPLDSNPGEIPSQVPSGLPAQAKKEVSLEKKQSWRLPEPRHSRQSSLASQEYPGPAAVTYQDSGYSTGPSPSLRRKNRRRVPGPGMVGSGRPGSAGSGELMALNDKLMAEMKAAVSRSVSKASLDTEMGSEASGSGTARSPPGSLRNGTRPGGMRGSREDVTTSEHSLYRNGGNSHGDVPMSPLAMEGMAMRQKRTYEKVDSLEKSGASQTSLSSPEPPMSPSQTGTLESKGQPELRPQHGDTHNDDDNGRPGHGTAPIPSAHSNTLQARHPSSSSTYQYPYSTLCKPSADVDMEDWASKNFNLHTQGLFRRRVSIANMLSWNGGSIKKPMLITSDRAVKKEACEMFKLVQVYMGDRPARLDRRHAALLVVTKCWGTQGLRDELYVQLVRQTTDNLCLHSLEAGWELMAISLAFFSPSPKFRRYLEGYIQRHLEPSNDKKILQRIMEQQDIKNKKNSKSRKKRKQNNEEEEKPGLPISTYAKYCYRKLQKVVVTGGKKGLRKPTLDEIDHGRNAIVTPSLFGSALEEIMERQSQLFPQRRLPWVQVQLSQCVLALGGAQTEGIFRVPGDIDEVNALKLQVDQWKVPENLSDPNVPASLLKLWYRELEEPVIPQSFYTQCISHYEDPEAAIGVVQSLPELNRLVLCYFIHFLQVFAQPVNVSKTKMDVNNLAMVMAPNCLRCQSDDPRIIFENTRKEMSFLRMLIVHLDTSFIQGLI
ncbi:rho GTPase-activating protein 39 isoform X1 [Colossoma macropomum]|uniref:rho GTPase-activating protein 39 isoform X1 n=2 Tax=Colossoma macropomum TaxID=42526 RepID=UPI0018653DDF|nr:rho GTPase-activating protein 39 isoform X1 [Colossoma macropomum]